MTKQADHYIIAINPPVLGNQSWMINQILSACGYEQGKAEVDFYVTSAMIDENFMLGLAFKRGYTPESADWDRTRIHNLSGTTRGKLLAIYHGTQSIHTPVPKLPLNNWALASFILSLLSLCGGPLTGVPAIVLGFVALRKIAASEGQTRGKELAWTGIIVGSVLAAISIFLILVALLSDISAR